MAMASIDFGWCASWCITIADDGSGCDIEAYEPYSTDLAEATVVPG